MSALDSTYRISIQCAYPCLSISTRVLHPKLILLESLQSCYTPAILSCPASPLQRRWCPVSGLFKPREGRLVSHRLLLLKTGPIEEIIYLIWIRKQTSERKRKTSARAFFRKLWRVVTFVFFYPFLMFFLIFVNVKHVRISQNDYHQPKCAWSSMWDELSHPHLFEWDHIQANSRPVQNRFRCKSTTERTITQ